MTSILDNTDRSAFKLDRNTLKTQTTRLLRQLIVSGRILPGTKLAERELADLLQVSRMPVRDALMDLEREGLIVSRPNGRYVIELRQEDVENLYQVRLNLEQLAVTLAAQHTNDENRAALQMSLQRMRQAIRDNDVYAYEASDLEAHELIWKQAHNPYLLKMLHSITGPIFMFIASQTKVQTNWLETFQLHEDLTAAICAGDINRAVQSIESHLHHSRQLSLSVFDEHH